MHRASTTRLLNDKTRETTLPAVGIEAVATLSALTESIPSPVGGMIIVKLSGMDQECEKVCKANNYVLKLGM
jgi:hypothetical protein